MKGLISGKTYWLIGASEGLGRELARELHRAGAHLVVSARNKDRLESLCSELVNAKPLPLDVTDDAAVRRASREVGEIDAVIYCAATYEPMNTVNWDGDAAMKMVDVNFLGAMRVLGEIVPQFVDRKHGRIVLIGSLAGYRGLPNAIGYGASKAAMVSLAETMRHDLKGTGITVQLVNPGFIETRLTEKNDFHMPMIMTPEKAAKHVMGALRSLRFRTDFPIPFSWALRCLRFLPDFVFYRGN